MAKSSGDGHNVTDIQQDILASAKGALKEAHKRGATLVQTDRDRFNQPSHRLTVDTANGEAFRTSQGLSSTNFSIEERFTNITESKWGIGPVLEYIKQQEDIPAWNADWV